MLFVLVLVLTVLLFALDVAIRPASYVALGLFLFLLIALFILSKWEVEVLRVVAILRDALPEQTAPSAAPDDTQST